MCDVLSELGVDVTQLDSRIECIGGGAACGKKGGKGGKKDVKRGGKKGGKKGNKKLTGLL